MSLQKLKRTVSSITWIENNVFLMIYTPTASDAGLAPASVFTIVTRTPPSSFEFRKIPEPVGPFGLNRSPPHHFLLRLRDWGNLQDLLIVTSTASTDIGLLSRSKSALTKDKPVVGEFTMTELMDDSRRAQIPADTQFNDTSPIGFALDLSSKEKVVKPIPGDEMDESSTPLPALMVLNNDGVLASWWIVYSDAVRQGTIYPNLAAAAGAAQYPQPSSPPPAQPTTSPFGETFKPTFGAPPNLGSAPAGAFGSTSNIGQKQSPWGAPTTSTAVTTNTPGFVQPTFGTATAPSTFGTPSFGKTSAPAFGSSGFSANKSSPWGTSNTSTPAFGQAANLGSPAPTFGSPAPSIGTTVPSSGGFGKFASQNGFAGTGATSTGSVFGAKQNSSIFGGSSSSPGTTETPFGSTETKPGQNQGGSFGGITNNFVLGSIFKPDGTAKDDAPASGNKTSFFGSKFGSALGELGGAPPPEPTISKDADMDTTEDVIKPEEVVKPSSTTPASTPAPNKTSFLPSGTSTGLFGTTGSSTVSSVTKPSASTGFNFGTSTTTQESKPAFSFAKLGASEDKPLTPATQTAALSKIPPSPVVKEEPSSETETGSPTAAVPDAPLPPDATSKSSYTAGDTSVSSTGTDAPLPPDFVTKPTPKLAQAPPPPSPPAKSIYADLVPPSDVPGGPEDEGDSSDFVTEEEGGEDSAEIDEGSEEEEGSGEDVAQDISPTSEANQTPGFTPQSSFGGQNRGTDNTLFTKIEKPLSHRCQHNPEIFLARLIG
jgi:nucleoporin NUP159